MSTSNILDLNLKPIEPYNIKVLIADDHPFYLEGLKIVLETLAVIKKVYEVTNGNEALKLIDKQQFHLVFLDIEMPEKNGMDTLREIRLQDKNLRVVMLSMHCSPDHVMQAYDLKANGYLLKEAGMEEVEKCVLSVLRGDSYYCEKAVEKVLQAMKSRYDLSTALHKKEATHGNELSPREIEVLQLLCKQYTTKEIGEMLNISEHTVKGHREKIKTKAQCKNMVGMVEYAIKHGFHMVG